MSQKIFEKSKQKFTKQCNSQNIIHNFNFQVKVGVKTEDSPNQKIERENLLNLLNIGEHKFGYYVAK